MHNFIFDGTEWFQQIDNDKYVDIFRREVIPTNISTSIICEDWHDLLFHTRDQRSPLEGKYTDKHTLIDRFGFYYKATDDLYSTCYYISKASFGETSVQNDKSAYAHLMFLCNYIFCSVNNNEIILTAKNTTYKLDLNNFIWENILSLLKTICIDISQLNAIQIWIKDKKEKYDEENSRNG